jgi:hypothetical protein
MDPVEQSPNVSALRDYVANSYGQQPSIGAESAIQHAARVADLVYKIADTHYRDVSGSGLEHDQHVFLPPAVHETMELLVCAAWLHEAVERSGRCFEDILAISNVTVANLVTTLSRDVRLPVDRRRQAYRSALQDISIEGQLLALADMICTAQAYKTWFKAEDTEAIDLMVFRQSQFLLDDLLALPKLVYHPVSRRYAVALQAGLVNLQTDSEARYAARGRRNKIIKIMSTRTVTNGKRFNTATGGEVSDSARPSKSRRSK